MFDKRVTYLLKNFDFGTLKFMKTCPVIRLFLRNFARPRFCSRRTSVPTFIRKSPPPPPSRPLRHLLIRCSAFYTVMREIHLKQANYFHKGFLTNFNLGKTIPYCHIFCILLSKCYHRNKPVPSGFFWNSSRKKKDFSTKF